MKKRCLNPYLPLNNYIPDGEPHVFNDRLYVYGSHDKENGDKFCPLDYVVWSAPIDDLSDWTCGGVIYRKEQDPLNRDGSHCLYAPDVVKGNDNRFYLYYSLDFISQISVAISDSPEGPFEYLGYVKYADGKVLSENVPFDPAVINDSGKIYLYYGFSPAFPMPGLEGIDLTGCSFVELKEDMLTVKNGPNVILPSKKHAGGTGFEGHSFFEAASIRKINNIYYLVYSSEVCHELCYATSIYPDREFKYGGIIVSNGDIGFNGRKTEERIWITGNNHGGLVEVKGVYYIFYHRHTHGTMFSRQGCVERVKINEDGKIDQVEMTSYGMSEMNLQADSIYPASIACNLVGKNGTYNIDIANKVEGAPIVESENGEQYINHIEDGSIIGFKYFDIPDNTKIVVQYRGAGEGCFELEDGRSNKNLGLVLVSACKEYRKSLAVINGGKDIFLILRYRGSGCIQLSSIEFIK